MEPAVPTSTSLVAAPEREPVELRVRRLAAARRRATALLAAVTALFVAVTAAGADGTLLGYVQAGPAAGLVVTVAEALRDEDVQQVLTAELTRAADAVEVAPLAGRALRVVIAGGHHADLFNTIVSGADRYLGDHYLELRQLFAGE